MQPGDLGDAGIVGAIAAAVTGIGLALRQLTAGRADVAQSEANRELYDMLREQIERLHSENRSLRDDIAQLRQQVSELQTALLECMNRVGDQ